MRFWTRKRPHLLFWLLSVSTNLSSPHTPKRNRSIYVVISFETVTMYDKRRLRRDFFSTLDCFKRYFLILNNQRVESRLRLASSPRRQGTAEGSSDNPRRDSQQTHRNWPRSRPHPYLPQTHREKRQSRHGATPQNPDAKSLKNLLKIIPVVLSFVQLSWLIR